MRKWGKQYRDFINKEIKLARQIGYPFWLWYRDRYGKQARWEELDFRNLRRKAYTKEGRKSGLYEIMTCRKDKRFTEG